METSSSLDERLHFQTYSIWNNSDLLEHWVIKHSRYLLVPFTHIYGIYPPNLSIQCKLSNNKFCRGPITDVNEIHWHEYNGMQTFVSADQKPELPGTEWWQNQSSRIFTTRSDSRNPTLCIKNKRLIGLIGYLSIMKFSSWRSRCLVLFNGVKLS